MKPFQFTVRSLLVALCLLSVAITWFTLEFRAAQRQASNITILNECGGRAVFDNPSTRGPVRRFLCSTFGPTYFGRVEGIGVEGTCDDALIDVSARFPSIYALTFVRAELKPGVLHRIGQELRIVSISFVECNIDNTLLLELRSFPKLRRLMMVGLAKEGLPYRVLSDLHELETLHLAFGRVDFQPIAGAMCATNTLTELNVEGSVCDNFCALGQLVTLRSVDLTRTNVTDDDLVVIST